MTALNSMLRLRCVATIVAVVTLISAASHAMAATPPKKIATVEGITEYQFDNGLRLLLYPDQSRPKVTVNMTVLVGSRH